MTDLGLSGRSDRAWKLGAYAVAALVHVPLIAAIEHFGDAVAAGQPATSVITLMDLPAPSRLSGGPAISSVVGVAGETTIAAQPFRDETPGAVTTAALAPVGVAQAPAVSPSAAAPVAVPAQGRAPVPAAAVAAVSATSVPADRPAEGASVAGASPSLPQAPVAATAPAAEPQTEARVQAPARPASVPMPPAAETSSRPTDRPADASRLAPADAGVEAAERVFDPASAAAVEPDAVAAAPQAPSVSIAVPGLTDESRAAAVPSQAAPVAEPPPGSAAVRSDAAAVADVASGARTAAVQAPATGALAPAAVAPAARPLSASGGAAAPMTPTARRAAVAVAAAPPARPAAAPLASSAARTAQPAATATATRVAAIAPEASTPASAAPRADRQAAFAEFARQYDGGGCFAALNAQVAPDRFAVSGFSRDESAWTAFNRALDDRAGFRLSTAPRQVSAAQCDALGFARRQPAYPDFELRLTLESDRLASGEAISGRIESFGGQPVTLLIVDDEGLVQDMTGRLGGQAEERLSFEAPLTLTSGPVATVQLLVALAGEGATAAIRPTSPVAAGLYFAELQKALDARGRHLDVAIAAFSVE